MAVAGVRQIELAKPNSALQLAAYESGAENKVFRAGRRAGKTVVDLLCGVVGHGPVVGGARKFLGVASGRGDVFWVLPTRSARNAIWHDAVQRRFPREWLNETDLTVTFPNGCRLWVISAEAINAVRGSGSRVLGVIVDEAAHLPLQTVLLRVILPVLADNEGWLILSSTTNAGQDGDRDENDQMRSPSYFNTLCEQIQLGQKGEDWAEFYWTARDNPAITDRALDRLIREYPAGSLELEQEVWAKLLVAGGRLAFPEYDESVHMVRLSPEREPALWRWSCGGDWGYDKTGWLGLFATELRTGRSVVRAEYEFSRTTPLEVGRQWGRILRRYPTPEFMVLDEPAVSDGGQTIGDRVQSGVTEVLGRFVPFTTPPKGPGSRETAKLEVHAVLKYERAQDGTIPDWGRPLVLLHRDCTRLGLCLQRLPMHPRGRSDVDSDAYDHPYDGLKDWLMATRGPHADRVADKLRKLAAKGPDDHAGRSTLMQRPEAEPDQLFAVQPFTTHDQGIGWSGGF